MAKLKFSLASQNGQVMLLTALILGGVLLGASTIAGYLMVVKLRESSDVVNSTRAIFAADSGIECELYKYNFKDTSPSNSHSRNCADNGFKSSGVNVKTTVNPPTIKSIGTAFNAKRAFKVDFSAFTGPSQTLTDVIKDRNCGRCSNTKRGEYVAWYASSGNCESQFNEPGNNQVTVEGYDQCLLCQRCSNVEPSTYVEWAPYYNACENPYAYNQDRKESICDSRCSQQPNCSSGSCSGGSCGAYPNYTVTHWYAPGGDCISATQCFSQSDSPTLNDSLSCPLKNPACPTCSDGIKNQTETGIDCGGPCAAVCPPPTTPTTLNQENSNQTMTANISQTFQGLLDKLGQLFKK